QHGLEPVRNLSHAGAADHGAPAGCSSASFARLPSLGVRPTQEICLSRFAIGGTRRLSNSSLPESRNGKPGCGSVWLAERQILIDLAFCARALAPVGV